jgi:hypothetical protein
MAAHRCRPPSWFNVVDRMGVVVVVVVVVSGSGRLPTFGLKSHSPLSSSEEVDGPHGCKWTSNLLLSVLRDFSRFRNSREPL